MYLDAYYRAVDRMLAAIRETQGAAIEGAAQVIADRLAARGVVFVMDTGHMLRHEAFMRAGGLLALTPFEYTLTVDTSAAHRLPPRPAEAEAGLEGQTVAIALERAGVQRGDVMLINSNSGRTPNVIEVALQCRERGTATIGLASVEQMSRCDPAHPSGKKLFDVVDVCIDTCGVYGDAMVEVEGNERMCPGSGMAAAYVLWAIQAEAVGLLQARGLHPSIYRSVHLGGHAFVEEQQRHYKETGI